MKINIITKALLIYTCNIQQTITFQLITYTNTLCITYNQMDNFFYFFLYLILDQHNQVQLEENYAVVLSIFIDEFHWGRDAKIKTKISKQTSFVILTLGVRAYSHLVCRFIHACVMGQLREIRIVIIELVVVMVVRYILVGGIAGDLVVATTRSWLAIG